MERSPKIEVLDSEVPPWAVQDPVPRAALGVCPWWGNLGECLVSSWAAGQGETRIVPAREGLETGLELPTMASSCPRDASNLSGALGGGGSSFGKMATTSDVALLGGCRSWWQLSRTCGTSTSTWKGFCRSESVLAWQPGVAHGILWDQ